MKYEGTAVEVMLGDRVLYRHLFFGQSNGVVAYIPGISAINPRILPYQWVVKLRNGKGVFMAFGPDVEFAHRRIRFVERGGSEDAIKASDPI